MKQGKLTNEQLTNLVLQACAPRRPEVVQGAALGEDCAVLQLDGLAVLSTDPVTAASGNAGRIAAHISVNDVASTGAEPVAMLATLLLPPDTTEAQLKELVEELSDTARSLGVDIVGGHTEVTDAVTRPVLSTTVIGRAQPGRLLHTGGAQPGDSIVLTKTAGIEGTAILYADHAALLGDALLPEDAAEIARMRDAISVLPESRVAAAMGATAMHDVTEGGVLGALHELCAASGVGARIREDSVPVARSTQKICRALGLNPLRLISSGAMLITVPGDGSALLEQLGEAGIAAAVIGEIVPREEGVRSERGEIAPPQPDELYKVF